MSKTFWLITGGVVAVALAGVYAVGKIRKNAIADLTKQVEPEIVPEKPKLVKSKPVEVTREELMNESGY